MTLKPFLQGHLIAIGGNEDRDEDLIVLKRVIQEVEKANYKVCIITTASEEPEKRAKDYKNAFTQLGASEIVILDIKERSQANDNRFVKKLENVDLIFLAGGDQLRLTTILGGSKLLQAIHRHLEGGTHMAGTSAGAAAFSDTMIYEGKSEEGLLKGKVLTTSGFGFVENIIFDTHFMARGRIGRLIQIITTNPTCIGVGLGEDSGILLKGDGTGEVIGTGQVIIVNGSNIHYSNIMNIQSGGAIAVENIQIHSIVDGYGYDFKNRKFLTPIKMEKSK
ncbi:MAG: cyanophycinase [Bacteriovoracaceae bacterium]|nr:cyanophycinase [Bacteriovoracaceae bacterium]